MSTDDFAKGTTSLATLCHFGAHPRNQVPELRHLFHSETRSAGAPKN
jgi:hypothetical protein